ncbi:hypothetical protein [Glutamicibacter sp.]|uniref:hypothetical protein n=1 Tax=Glutamicibacter sp. TaxID=1931995 RepID=UPI0028BF3DFE|nr:hypothetical protein [Glutamicibacter sp.]
MNSNTNPTMNHASEYQLPATAFGCTPREPTAEEDNLLTLLIAQLDLLTQPPQGGKLK